MAQLFEISALLGQQGSRSYQEFLRVPALSTGLYVLPAGAEDRQRPHAEDEVYYVVRGRSLFRSAGEDYEVRPGAVLFVEANEEHRFHAIAEDLVLLVLFAPAETL